MIARRRRLFALVLVLPALALVASACSSTMNDAATVQLPAVPGQAATTLHITRSSFQDELNQLQGTKAFRDLLQTSNLTAANSETMNSNVAAYLLSQRIGQAIVDHEFAAHGLKLTDTDIENARAELADTSQSAQVSPILEDVFPPATFASLPKNVQDLFAQRRARADVLLRYYQTPSDQMIQDYYNSHLDQVQCKRVSHILVSSEAEAKALLAQLQSGASFADLAKSKSTDTQSAQNGGQLGCLTPNEFVPDFQKAADAAPLDTVVGPVHTQFGYHLILVTKPTVTLESARSQILSALASGGLVRADLDRAKVRVDPVYGTAVGPGLASDQVVVYQVKPPAVAKPAVSREGAKPTTTTATTVPAGATAGG